MSTSSHEMQYLLKFTRVAWRRKWWLLIIQIAISAAVIAGLMFLPKEYESKTVIRVEKEKVINPLTKGLAVTSEMEERIRTIKEEILSRDYIDKVINRLKLEPFRSNPLEHEKLVNDIIEKVKITFDPREIDTFEIVYRGVEPTKVRDITNTLAGIFIEESLAYKETEAGSAVEFLNDQLGVYRQKLEESEAVLRQFEEKHVDELPSTKVVHLAKLEALRTNLNDVRSNLRQAKVQRDMIIGGVQNSAAANITKTVDKKVPNPLQGRIKEQEDRLKAMQRDFSDSYPDVISLKAEIAGMKKELEANPTVSVEEVLRPAQSPVQEALLQNQLQQLEGEIQSMTLRESQLENEIERFEKKVRVIPQVEQELIRLRRDYDVNSDIYNNFLRRVEEARISQKLEVAKKGAIFRILQSAPLPLIPVSPQRVRVALAGVGAGLAAAAALVYLIVIRDTSFNRREEIEEALKLSVLIGIPAFRTARTETLATISGIFFTLMLCGYAFTITLFLYWEDMSRLARFIGGA